jgi:hypothetical protein
MREIDDLFDGLSRSAFRQRFHLVRQEWRYLEIKGLPTIMEHARDVVDKRLAPRDPPNEGMQTPFRGHPVFVAQHATAACCRTCLAKWHSIPNDRALNEEERRHVLAVLERWLRREVSRHQSKFQK